MTGKSQDSSVNGGSLNGKEERKRRRVAIKGAFAARAHFGTELNVPCLQTARKCHCAISRLLMAP